MTQNKTFVFFTVGIIALVIGIFIGTNLVSPQLAPANTEQEGQVVLMGTPGIFPSNKNPVLKTNYFGNVGAIGRIKYVQPNFINIQQTPIQRACFGMTYLDSNKGVINVTGLGVASNLCIAERDNGMVIEVLKIVPLIINQKGRTVITAPQIT